MAYSKENKEKIAYLRANLDIVYQEYIVNGKSTYQLAEEWGIPKSTVYQLTKDAKLTGIKLAEKLTSCNESKFNIQDPIFCYMAGLASADGYLDEKNHRLVLRMAVGAKDTLQYLHDYFEVSTPVTPYSGSKSGFNPHDRMMYDLTISSRKLLDVLASLNIVGRKKDLGVRFPDMSKLSDECQEMYMRGLWDGDGAAVKGSWQTSILEESKAMIEAIKSYLEDKLEIEIRYYTESKYPSIQFNGENVKVFYGWLYRHNLYCKIQYKYENSVMK